MFIKKELQRIAKEMDCDEDDIEVSGISIEHDDAIEHVNKVSQITLIIQTSQKSRVIPINFSFSEVNKKE